MCIETIALMFQENKHKRVRHTPKPLSLQLFLKIPSIGGRGLDICLTFHCLFLFKLIKVMGVRRLPNLHHLQF